MYPAAWCQKEVHIRAEGYTEKMARADLGGASKELAKDALLDIIQLPNAGSYAGSQLLIDIGVSTQSLQPHKRNAQSYLRGQSFKA